MSETSTKPYLIRAIHEWCTDNGYRPFIAVVVDEQTQVPKEYVRDGEIVLNVSPHATNRLRIGNDLIEFEARFNGIARQISVPVENVSAIYAAESGQGMAFEGERTAGETAAGPVGLADRTEQDTAAQPPTPLVPVASRDRGANKGAPHSPPPREPSPPDAPGPGTPPRRPTLTRVK